MTVDFNSIKRHKLAKDWPSYTYENRLHVHPVLCSFCRVHFNPYCLPFSFCTKCRFIVCEKCASSLDGVDYTIHTMIAFSSGDLIQPSNTAQLQQNIIPSRSKNYYGTSSACTVKTVKKGLP